MGCEGPKKQNQPRKLLLSPGMPPPLPIDCRGMCRPQELRVCLLGLFTKGEVLGGKKDRDDRRKSWKTTLKNIKP